MIEGNSNNNQIIHPDDKELFLRTLNKKGFFLEDKAWKLLHDEFRLSPPKRNKVLNWNDERVEIDLILKQGNKVIIMDCKRTDYTWIFPRAIERNKTLNIIYNPCDFLEGNVYKITTRTSPDFEIAWCHICIEFNERGRLRSDRSTPPLAKTSYKDVEDAATQILKNTEAYLNLISREERCIVYPVIVTNSNLCLLDYSKSRQNENGDLVDYQDFRKIDCVVYNWPEIMKFKDKVISNVTDAPNQDKSIFIVNIETLIPTINRIFKLTD